MNKELWKRKKDHIHVMGHRGIMAFYPENTMVSFKAAAELGVDIIEFDVNITGDGELVVIHDNTVDRTTFHTGKTREYTLAELKEMDFGVKFDEKFKGERIPTLAELLEYVKTVDGLLMNVEIKDYSTEVVDKTVAMLREYGLYERATITCFESSIVKYTKATYPDMLVQGFPEKYMKNFTEDTYGAMDAVSVFIVGKTVTPKEPAILANFEIARQRGFVTSVTRAENITDIQRCVDYNCDQIVTNDPVQALNYLRSLGLHK